MQVIGKYAIIKIDDQSYKSDKGIVAPRGLEKAGNTLKGELISDFGNLKKDTRVEFVKNQAYQIRPYVYIVEPEYIIVKGDLDLYLDTNYSDKKDGE